jgi:hypothetical protein
MAVTIDDIKALVPPVDGKPTDAQYTAALDTATLIRTEQLTGVSGCTMSEERLDKITIYLGAYFIEPVANAAAGIPAGGLRRDRLGESDQSYFGPGDDATGYATSKWGQLAMALDTCNILAGSMANNGLKAQFRVVGGERS